MIVLITLKNFARSQSRFSYNLYLTNKNKNNNLNQIIMIILLYIMDNKL